MARPSKLTPERQQRIIDAIKLGVHLETAANYGGVTYATYRLWMVKGEAARSGSYREFYDAVTRATLEIELQMVGRIVLEAKTDWRAAEVWLKRRLPEKYGTTMKLTGADGGPIQTHSTREQALQEGQERARKLRAV